MYSLTPSLIQADLLLAYSWPTSTQFCFGYFCFIAMAVFWAVKMRAKETQSMQKTAKDTIIVLQNLYPLVK